MSEQASTSHSIRVAALAVLVVALITAGIIAGMTYLDSVAPKTQVMYQTGSVAQAQQPFYVLLIGSDSRKGTALYTGKADDHAQTDQHSDIMTLMRIDPTTYQITLVTVPRDTESDVTGSRINDALLDDDPNQVVDAVAELTGVHADYYMMTTFISYENIIDALGGVQVDVPKTVTVLDPATAKDITVKAGVNLNLKGPQALVFARARKEYVNDQDAIRQTNVRSLEQSMIEKVMSGDIDVDSALNDLRENTTSNMDWNLAKTLINLFVEHADEAVVYSGTGPYEGTENENGDWTIPEDREAWAEVMETVTDGGDPAAVLTPPTYSG